MPILIIIIRVVLVALAFYSIAAIIICDLIRPGSVKEFFEDLI